MSDAPATQAKFLEALSAIVASECSTTELTGNLRAALLDYASETPDNRDAAARVEVGLVGSTIGPKLVGQTLLLSGVAHALEEVDLPRALKQSLPTLSEKDWEAFTRLTTLIYTLLERQSKIEP